MSYSIIQKNKKDNIHDQVASNPGIKMHGRGIDSLQSLADKSPVTKQLKAVGNMISNYSELKQLKTEKNTGKGNLPEQLK